MNAIFLRAAVSLIFISVLRASAAAPSVATGNPTNITTNSATLNGTANPNGLATSAYFEWGTTTNYGSVTAPQSLGAGSSDVAVQANLASLLTDTNYHYRLVASNASGIAFGSDVIVTPTLLLYLYAGESWVYEFKDFSSTNFLQYPGFPFSSASFAIMPGSFGEGSSARFEMFENSTNDPTSPSSSQVINAPANSAFLSDSVGGVNQVWADRQGVLRITALSGSLVVSGISIQRIKDGGSGFHEFNYHSIVPTRLPQPPTIITQFLSSATTRSATVRADVNAKNLATGLFLHWGLTTNYGFTSGPVAVDRDYPQPKSIGLSNLAPDTVYHLRFVATNSAGTNYGYDLTFKTLNNVVTQPANNQTTTSAVANASVAIEGGVATSAYFQWGTTTNYGQVTSLQNLGSATTVSNISAPLTGLAPLSIFHFRATAVSGGVTNFGSDLAFATTPPPTNSVITNLVTDDVRGAILRGGTVTIACDGVLVLSNQIEIANDVNLDASGHDVTFSGNNATRIFSVAPGTLFTLTNLTLVNGKHTNAGGAIYNQGTIIAESCGFSNNTAIAAAGTNGTNGANGSLVTNPNGQPGSAGTPGGNAEGGAIFNSGSLLFRSCTFGTNSAVGGNGGNGGAGGNSAGGAGRQGGAGGNGAAGGVARGGSIANYGTVVIDGCIFSHSMAGGGRGGNGGTGGQQSTFNTPPVSPSGLGAAGGAALGGSVFNVGTMYLSNSLFVSSAAQGAGGGDEISLLNNYVLGGHGGLATGGAIYNSNNSAVVNCTFSGNTARGGTTSTCNCGAPGVKGGDAMGGAIANAGAFQAVNLTVDGSSSFPGLGTCLACGPSFRGTNGNSYGGSIANTGGVFQIVNSILSGGFSNNCFGAITDLGHNISSDATPVWTSGTSLNNTDPLLLPLANNGGPTLTMALRAGSPALNTADCALAPATDQRGYPRPSGPGCEIGAYEGPGTTSLQIVRQSSSTNVLRWLAEAGQVYRLDITTDFTGWTPYATNTAGASGWLDFPVPADLSPRFFRLAQ